MSTIKTKIAPKTVLKFLQKKFDSNILRVNFIEGGEMSQAFSFTSKNDDFIIRVYRESYSFEKDKYAYEHFANKDLPIPKVLSIGEFNRILFYAISKKAKGKHLDKLDEKTLKKLVPEIIKIHDEIRNIKINNTGYGWWDKNGNTKYKSWKDSLLSKKEHVEEDLQKTKTNPSKERGTIESVYKEMIKYLKFVPEIKHLVHADLGGSNMIYDGKKITGVLDFANSLYGDFLYDIAWLDFWWPEIGYKKEFKKHYIETGVDIADFEERILCYKLHMGLGILGFFLLSEQKEKYEWAKNKLLKLLEESRI